MLWLAGLFGLMAVGGIAFAGDESDEISEGDHPGDPSSGSNVEQAFGLVTHTPEGPGSEGPNTSDGGQVLPGDEQVNAIAGGIGNDQINGYDGADLISGAGGDDLLYGGAGDDQIAGDAGDDTLHGESGADTLTGGDGKDLIFGHGGDDFLAGGRSDDELHGGFGDDLLKGGEGDDALHGGEGNDHLKGEYGRDTLFGGWGNDWLSGLTTEESGATGEAVSANADDSPDADSDFLNGGGGDDTILAGAGDIVTAGDGKDTIVLGDWIAQGAQSENQTQLLDFDSTQDKLLMVCDMDDGGAPEVEVTADPNVQGVSHILVGGTEIAIVRGGRPVIADDIVLIDRDDAAVLGIGL